MGEDIRPLDITDTPELLQLAEEVRRTKEPRLLRRDGEDLAIVVPLAPTSSRRRRAKASLLLRSEAVLAASGSWKGLIDAEALKEQLRAERSSGRTPASL
jgi:hypothetical protein